MDRTNFIYVSILRTEKVIHRHIVSHLLCLVLNTQNNKSCIIYNVPHYYVSSVKTKEETFMVRFSSHYLIIPSGPKSQNYKNRLRS